MQADPDVAAAERVRLGPPPAGEPPPVAPAHFDHRYELPKHQIKRLELSHPHALDSLVEFHEEPHIYEIKGFPAQASVSGLADDFE